MVKIPCPKCKSRATYITTSRHPWLPEPDEILVCSTCGTRVYGRERVAPLREAVLVAERLEEARREEERVALQRAIEEERAARAAAEKAAADTAAKAAAEQKKAARRAALEAEILRNAKCAWPPCENDHTMTSRYCSRTCSNKNAHAREKAKKEAAKGTAA
jgi:dTMP kinase